MRVTFLHAAEVEMFQSVAYFEQKDPGLGARFLEEVEAATDVIVKFPESGTLLNSYARRVLLDRFQYGVVYRIYNDQIIILAVMHLKRKPNYWVKRQKP
jgi:toxin ParE1/3/4